MRMLPDIRPSESRSTGSQRDSLTVEGLRREGARRRKRWILGAELARELTKSCGHHPHKAYVEVSTVLDGQVPRQEHLPEGRLRALGPSPELAWKTFEADRFSGSQN